MLNTTGMIGKILTSKHSFEFYSCYLLKAEILKHRNKILKFSKLSSGELDEVEQMLFGNIEFINEHLIPKVCLEYGEDLTTGIDIDDAPFVALTKYLKGRLWTGDKELQSGLLSKGYKKVMTTGQLSDLYRDFENGQRSY